MQRPSWYATLLATFFVMSVAYGTTTVVFFGGQVLRFDAPAASPAVAPAGKGVVYYSPDAGFLASGNGGAFSPLGSGAGGNAVHGTSLVSFGDSITFGFGSSVAYPILVCRRNGWSLSTLAVSSNRVIDLGTPVYAQTPNASSSQNYSVMIGVNDANTYSAVPASAILYEDALGAELAWLAIPSTRKILGTDTVNGVETGTWVADSSTAWGIGRQSQTNGSTKTWSVTGSTIYVATKCFKSNFGAFTISVDGVSQGSFSTDTPSDFDQSTYNNGAIAAPKLVRLTGFSTGAHTVLMTVTSATSASNKVWVDWVAGSGGAAYTASTAPIVVVSNITAQPVLHPNGGTEDGTASYNVIVRRVQRNLSEIDGYDVRLADVFPYTNNDSLLSDHLHLNDYGHIVVADVISSAFIGGLSVGPGSEKILASAIAVGASSDMTDPVFGAIGADTFKATNGASKVGLSPVWFGFSNATDNWFINGTTAGKIQTGAVSYSDYTFATNNADRGKVTKDGAWVLGTGLTTADPIVGTDDTHFGTSDTNGCGHHANGFFYCNLSSDIFYAQQLTGEVRFGSYSASIVNLVSGHNVFATLFTTGGLSIGSTPPADPGVNNLRVKGSIQTSSTPVTTKPSCAADSDVGKWVSYSKLAGATVSMCFCQKVASS